MTTPKKLMRAAELGHDRIKHMRDARVSFITKYVGDFYARKGTGNDEDRKATPLNLMYQAITTYVANLVYADPVADVSSPTLLYRPYAEVLGLATDSVIRTINLRKTLRLVTADAMFGAGIMKNGIASSGEIAMIESEPYAIGRPYADRVDLDDYVLDPMCRTREEAEFEGHIIRVPKELLLESGLLANDVIEKLSPSVTLSEGASQIGGRVNVSEVRDYVDLLELYLPHENAVVMLPWKNGEAGQEFLDVREYLGPSCGPFHMLGFSWVPDNPMPVPPAGMWNDLHEMVNRVARKVGRQAQRNKKLFLYEIGEELDAEAIRESGDMEFVGVSNPDKVKEVELGGATDSSYEFLQWAKGEFSQQAGNLDLMSGAQSTADTATEAEMLRNSQGVRLSDMSEQVYHFTGDVMGAIAYYLHTDPLIDLPLAKRVGAQDIQLRYTPEMRQGEFFEYNIRVRPYSMQRMDPQQRMRKKLDIFGRVVPSLVQATVQCAQLGIAFRADKALASLCKDAGVEDADEFFPNMEAFVQRQQLMMQMGAPPDGQAAQLMGGGQPAPAPTDQGFRPEQPVPGAGVPQQAPDPAMQQAQQGANESQANATSAPGGFR
jgi:hypothetical protein